MTVSSYEPDSTFTAQARTVGISAAWMAFAISGVYAAVSPARAVIVGILDWGAAGPIVFLLLAKVFRRVQAVTVAAPAC